MAATFIHSTESRYAMSAAPSTTLAHAKAWIRRYVTPFFTALAILALCVMLVFAIYLTQADLEWTAFLFGVLFAAILSLVTQNIKVQWRLVRRNAQLRRSKELLAEAVTRTERSAQALKMADQRFGAVLDALPAMVFFVDREERCRFHNLAFANWCGKDAADIGRLSLSALVPPPVHQALETQGRAALLGAEAQFDTQWPFPDGERPVAVKLLPYPVGAQTASGFYVFVFALPTARAEVPAAAAAPDASSAAVYLDAMEQQLPTSDDPREYLLNAIEEDQFLLLEQPIEPLVHGERPAVFREILLRLREHDDRTLPPGGFIEVAEHHGLMPAIDRWVIRKLLKSAAAMKEADRSWHMPVYSVNLNDATVCDRTFANHVAAQLRHWKLPGAKLCFEVRHRALAEHESDIKALMEHLKPLGCLFTVDGFGSHKVSFAPFTRLQFDFVKIDSSIVGSILRDKSELAKARAIVLACNKIDVRTIAPGVEEQATREKVKEIGVDYVQGFGIESPGPLGVLNLSGVPVGSASGAPR
jgi:EAL domain-containing protein (putative c-di-GMP-specific phosphodiesterase class I)/PAS domain-containing protein